MNIAALARCLSCLALLVSASGCSDSASKADAGFACTQSVATECAKGDPPQGQFGVHCALTLSAAERDPALCGGSPSTTEMVCGVYTTITVTNVDFSYIYTYDASGTLVAISSNGLVLGTTCIAGSPSFSPPAGPCTAPAPLPGC